MCRGQTGPLRQYFHLDRRNGKSKLVSHRRFEYVPQLLPGCCRTTLPETLEQRLRSYSIAAAAAGVGMLALAHPAEAEVVITHKVIPVNGTAVSIDINNDGIADFQFQTFQRSDGGQPSSNGWSTSATVKPLASGGVIGAPSQYRPGPYASALRRDVMISRFKHFSSKGKTIIGRVTWWVSKLGYGGGYVYGNWVSDPQNRYLGVKFLIDGETHYGWVRLKTGYYGAEVTIESYAYETDADTPICAREVGPCPAPPDDAAAPGETGQNVSGPSLGMLALGADALALWRREALAF